MGGRRNQRRASAVNGGIFLWRKYVATAAENDAYLRDAAQTARNAPA